MDKKEVVWPIKVPVGAYCWDYNIPGSCDYFDNEGGHPDCELKFYDQKSTKFGVLKDPRCAQLKDAPVIPKHNSESYDELKNIAAHIAECADLEAILTSHEEDILIRLQGLSDEELKKEKEFYEYES